MHCGYLAIQGHCRDPRELCCDWKEEQKNCITLCTSHKHEHTNLNYLHIFPFHSLCRDNWLLYRINNFMSPDSFKSNLKLTCLMLPFDYHTLHLSSPVFVFFSYAPRALYWVDLALYKSYVLLYFGSNIYPLVIGWKSFTWLYVFSTISECWHVWHSMVYYLQNYVTFYDDILQLVHYVGNDVTYTLPRSPFCAPLWVSAECPCNSSWRNNGTEHW